MEIQQGNCPHCDSPGIATLGCGHDVCGQIGYHFVPREYYAPLATITHRERDPRIGLMVADYLLVGHLGSGAFGDVYLALQLPVLMKTALKLMIRRPDEDDSLYATLLRKFEGEAASLAHLNHPNIVRLLKYGKFRETPYLVMEYVANGRTLKEEVASRARAGTGIPAGLSRHIIMQILNGLESAHNEQIIHRDIKPENMMLQRVTGDDYLIRILDFGLAKFFSKSDKTSGVIGTPMYMAPEQILARDLGAWTDLYAIGTIAFELITGKRPFWGETKNEVFRNKLDPDFDPVDQVAHLGYSESVLAFLRRATALQISDRYQTAAAFREEAQRVFAELSGSPSLNTTNLSGLLTNSEIQQYARLRDRIKKHKEDSVEGRSRPHRPQGTSGPPGEAPQGNTAGADPLGLTGWMDPASRSEPPSRTTGRGQPVLTTLLLILAIIAVAVIAIVEYAPRLSLRSLTNGATTEPLRAVSTAPTRRLPGDESSVGIARPQTTVHTKAPTASTKTPTVKTKVPPPTTPVATKPTPMHPPTATVTVKIDSTPSGAELYLGKHRLGQTPMVWTTARNLTPVLVTVKKKHYRSEALLLLLDRPRAPYLVTLKRRGLRPTRHTKKKKTPDHIDILGPH